MRANMDLQGTMPWGAEEERVGGLHRDPSLLYPVAEAAALLGISRSNLYCLLRQGKVSSVRIGSRRLVPRAALESFVATLPVAS